MKTIETLLGIKNPWPTVERLYARVDAEKNHEANKKLIESYINIVNLIVGTIIGFIITYFIALSSNNLILFIQSISIPIRLYIDNVLTDIDKRIYPIPEHEKRYLQNQQIIREMQLRRE